MQGLPLLFRVLKAKEIKKERNIFIYISDLIKFSSNYWCILFMFFKKKKKKKKKTKQNKTKLNKTNLLRRIQIMVCYV